MNPKIEKIIEFHKIRQSLASYASTDLGKQMAQTIAVMNQPQKIQDALDETGDGVELYRLKNGIPIPRLKDISMAIKRLELEAVLNGQELSGILRTLTTSKQVSQFFDKVREEELDLKRLYPLADKIVHLPEITRTLQDSISEDGRVLDDASPALKAIRQGISRAEQAVRSQLESYLSGKSANYLSDNLITIRNDRYVVPVKAEYRNVFGGIVHDQSSTGQTLFMEPQAVVTLNNKLKELQSQEKAEVERILYELSMELVPYTEDLRENHYLLGLFDLINAKAIYAHHLKATRPRVNLDNHIAIWQGRHPLIDPDRVVANDILIGQEYQAIVITGPNTGGKTIQLKTLGMIQLMAQAGLYIPANENSQVGIFNEIFADIGDEQSIEQNLSTFSSHMTTIVHILDQIDDKSLVLLDEIGSGTDPQEGASLAIAILDYIGSKNSFVVATTHYPELKAYGYNRPGTINASMEFDSDSLQPTYRLLLGIPGRSNAFDISSRLGLPDQVIEQARSFISLESQDLNEMISDLEQKRRLVERESIELQDNLEASQILLDDLQKEYVAYQTNKERLIDSAKEKANDLLEKTQVEAEAILSNIRDLQLKGQANLIKEHEMIEQRANLSQLKHERSLSKNKVLKREKVKKSLKVGQTVDVTSFGQKGVLVEEVSPKEWVVQMGIIKMKMSVDELVPLEDDKDKNRKSQVILRSANASHVSSELDLRGQRYENALKELDQYLDAAILAGYPRVTIIHGKGTGALQQGVHKALKNHRSVASFEYAPMNTGGTGATIVLFK